MLAQLSQPMRQNVRAFEALVNRLEEIIFVKDKNGRFTFMNSAGLRLLGLPLAEIVGKDETDLFGPAAGFAGWESDHQVFTSKEAQTSELHWQCQGEAYVLQVTKQAFENEQGDIEGLIGFGRIISGSGAEQAAASARLIDTVPTLPEPEPKEKRPSSSQSPEKPTTLNRTLLTLQSAMIAVAASLDRQHILETLTWEMVHLLDVDDCIVFDWAPAMQTITLLATYSQETNLNTQPLSLVNYPLFLQVVTERRPVQLITEKLGQTPHEHRLLTAIGIRSMVILPMIYQEEIFGLVGLADLRRSRELTDWEISLAQLLANQAASGLVNTKLYEKLGQANKALRASNEELDAFAHTVAHDLKGPLGLIMGFSDLILQEGESLSPKDLGEFLQIIAGNGKKMKDIINGLLMLSTVRQGEVKGEYLDMMQYVIEAKNRVTRRFAEFQVELVLPESLPVAWGYGPWVEEVWVNYLSNAVKYGGRPPKVEIGAVLQEDNMIRYWVSDNGRGLSAEQQAQLFTPFTRLNQVKIEGHGLGLSIVRRIVEKLGGEVGIESEPGNGSIFYFTLPRNEA